MISLNILSLTCFQVKSKYTITLYKECFHENIYTVDSREDNRPLVRRPPLGSHTELQGLRRH